MPHKPICDRRSQPPEVAFLPAGERFGIEILSPKRFPDEVLPSAISSCSSPCREAVAISLSGMTHNSILCVKSHIDNICGIAHILSMLDLARDPKQLGNAIRRARKAKRLSQQDLASRVGLRQESISLIENGNPATRIDTILAILSALGLELQVDVRSRAYSREAGGS